MPFPDHHRLIPVRLQQLREKNLRRVDARPQLPLPALVASFTPENIPGQIANMHTLFNIVTTLLLLPLGTQMAALTERILPAAEGEEPASQLVAYPLLEDVIAGEMGPTVSLVDVGCESAYEIKRQLKSMDRLAPEGAGHVDYYASDRPADFQRLAASFLREDLEEQVHPVDIEKY